MSRTKGAVNNKPVPEIQRAVEVACKRLSQRALAVLENAMDDAKTPGLEYRWRIMAAKEILDRAWGKPKIAVESTVKHETVDAMAEALQRSKNRVNKLVEASKPLYESDGVSVH